MPPLGKRTHDEMLEQLPDQLEVLFEASPAPRRRVVENRGLPTPQPVSSKLTSPPRFRAQPMPVFGSPFRPDLQHKCTIPVSPKLEINRRGAIYKEYLDEREHMKDAEMLADFEVTATPVVSYKPTEVKKDGRKVLPDGVTPFDGMEKRAAARTEWEIARAQRIAEANAEKERLEKERAEKEAAELKQLRIAMSFKATPIRVYNAV
eukprot:NODE_1542_length_820_cov_78.907648_g1494_i0.p1 GENE.NODE_1542_length_820_cov_78.907648_g1494_i0~~NODE_1542_length_820_cov_78.907648_g1494_i0.p1  ORF type:complete len:206 (+),score=38.08 NODE_1542_length_820_cov_78.907648_g1494_i0:135-752(+)